ncbi:MAG: type II toxin-antitoxin system VapC family toxin [Desulfosarcina sp.]|nr:type II toxin-antitoxin system VapC family toxin [Desulfobacterales bacterium]
MKIVIVDTSALIRLYVPDGPIPDGLEEYLAAAWRAEITLMIPELALAEFVQVLWKKEQAGYLELSEVDEIVAALLELPLEITGHQGILTDALSLARQYKLTVYDSLFLSLAMKRKAELITADQRLKNAFEDNRGSWWTALRDVP